MEMKDEILNMLKELRPEYDYEESSDFIEDGLLDSFDVIALTDMLQEKFGIVVDGLDIVPENYCNIDAIEALVKKSPKR